uniref:Uncharacterized protein n=1 Tax=Clytia hemisphaerica TaxID=252671 RepID=A0A7M5V0D5_9CNID
SKLCDQTKDVSFITYSAASLLTSKHQTSIPVPITASTFIHSPWQQKKELLFHTNNDSADISINSTKATDITCKRRSSYRTPEFPHLTPDQSHSTHSMSIDFPFERIISRNNKSDSFYKESDDTIDDLKLNPNLDKQKLINLKETDL